jgi:hypothetical protein
MPTHTKAMRAGDISVRLASNFLDAFGRAGGTPGMLQRVTDTPFLMAKFVALFEKTTPATESPTPGVAPLTEALLLRDYFVNRPGLYIRPGFQALVLDSDLKTAVKKDIGKVCYVDVPHDMFDADILARFIGNASHIALNSFSLAQIAAMIDLQNKGEAGPMLLNGYANIFCVQGADDKLLFVTLCWSHNYANWRIEAFDTDENGSWNEGCRVFRLYLNSSF